MFIVGVLIRGVLLIVLGPLVIAPAWVWVNVLWPKLKDKKYGMAVVCVPLPEILDGNIA